MELIYQKDLWYATEVSLLDGEWVVALEVIPCTFSIYCRCMRFSTTVLAYTHTHLFVPPHTHIHVHECDKSPTLVRQPCVKLCSDCSSSRFVTNASAHSDAHEMHRAVLVALVFYKVHRCFVYVIFSSGFRRTGRVGNRLFAEWVPDTAERSVDLDDPAISKGGERQKGRFGAGYLSISYYEALARHTWPLKVQFSY